MKSENLLERITVDPKVMVGKPVIRGTRIPVALILKMLSQGIVIEDILQEYPRLKREDVDAAMRNRYVVVTENGIRVRR